jgi:hypothetical protein
MAVITSGFIASIFVPVAHHGRIIRHLAIKNDSSRHQRIALTALLPYSLSKVKWIAPRSEWGKRTKGRGVFFLIAFARF